MDEQTRIAGITGGVIGLSAAMTQLGSERAREVMPRLDSKEFARVVDEYLAQLE